MKKSIKHPNDKDDKRVKIILMIMLILLTCTVLGIIGYALYSMSEFTVYQNDIISVKNINVSVEVGTRTGINGDRDAFKFGPNKPGGGGTKYVDINSTERALVILYLSGNISDYLTVERNNFIVEPGEFVHLPVNLDLPANLSFGNYSGIITVVLTRPKANNLK